jgi:tetratricopeptide (TPR) repeat protein
MNLDKLKDAARRHELREEWRKAIEIYHRALSELGKGGEPADPSLFNRIGDLELKAGDPAAALNAYEQAADTYADQGFFNNAIALCGKILRVSPNRTSTFLRLADLHARKNVVAESRRNLQEFLERMLAANHVDQLKSALRTYADRYSASAEFRSMLVEMLGTSGRTEQAREFCGQILADLGLREGSGPTRDQERRARSAPATGGLVFLDTGIDIPGIPVGGPSGEFALPVEMEESFTTGEGTATVENMPVPDIDPLPFMQPTVLDESTSTADLEPHVLSGFEPTQVGQEVQFPDFDSPLIIEERPDPLDIPGLESIPDFSAPVGGELGFEPMSLDEESGLLSLDASPSAPGSDELFDELSVEVEPVRPGAPVDELDAALADAIADERWDDAVDVIVRLIRLEPDSVPRHQKRVEIGYRSGNRQYLIDAYLSLAQALERIGATENAGLVFHRVLEHDPGNPVALAGLAALSVGGGAAPAVDAGPLPLPATPVEPAIAEPAAAPPGGFVDLGQLILEPEPEKDTRMRIDQGEPQSEEDVDFRETLQQFKEGVEANLDASDFQAHYDLGIAFKEMGLLDEAIAQFQKALRAPEGRLKSSEALGVAFFEKQRYGIAETVLSRAVEALPGADDEKIALIYWWGRALEAQHKNGPALRCYERALAVDITFLDLGQRIQRLTAENLQ